VIRVAERAFSDKNVGVNDEPWLRSWLQKVAHRLAEKGYERFDPAVYEPLGFKYAARRTESTALGLGSREDFFIFAETRDLDAQRLSNFTTYAFDFADANTTFGRTRSSNVLCYAVAVTEDLDPQLALHIQRTAPQVRFGAVEMTVAFDLASGQLAYFQGTSLWGLFYCDEMRREIVEVLS